MAYKGLRRQGYCPVTVTKNADGTETETLGQGKALPRVMRVVSSPSVEEVALYGDDGVAESDLSGGYGSMTVDLCDLSVEDEAALLGHSLGENGEMVCKQDDVAPYVRCGSIIPGTTENVPYYRVVVYTRVKFSPVGEDTETRGKTVAFKTPSLTGNFFPNAEGIWRKKQTFPTLAAAETYFNTELGIVPAGGGGT